MPDSTRKYNRRELEASINNIDWSIQHISRVTASFMEVINSPSNQLTEIPETYDKIMTALTTANDGLEVTKSLIFSVLETM